MTVLADVLSRTTDGIVVIDGYRCPVYANPAAARLLGRPLEELIGHDLLNAFDPAERDRIADALPHGLDKSVAPFLFVLTGADGVERDVLGAAFAFAADAGPWSAISLRPLDGPGAVGRIGNALARSAGLVEGGTTRETLAGLARLAVIGTRATACGIITVDANHQLTPDGSYGFPENGQDRMGWTTSMVLEDLPGWDGLLRHRTLVRSRESLQHNPLMDPFLRATAELDWQSMVYAPSVWNGEMVGFFSIFLPARLRTPSAAELSFYSALAARGANVVVNARLTASQERTRLARDLHDSVSQALFSMTMHARAAQTSMVRAGLDPDEPLGKSVEQLVELSKGALAEMHALIFELRPDALTEEGLTAALAKQVAALSAREGIQIRVEAPGPRLDLLPTVEEHLYRMVSEALHNVVKHSRAEHARVTVTRDDEAIRILVYDDGVGFDPLLHRAGHLGLSTMTHRATTIGAHLSINSAPGSGTTVDIRLARPQSPEAD